MSQVLARVTTGHYEVPRGPDVIHRISIERSWLASGEQIELVLPRNLACAACEGGGCDVCGRSGAISLRGRRDPVERLRLALPARSSEELAAGSLVVVRVPERGGSAPANSPLPRGMLFLKITPAAASDASVHRVTDSGSQLRLDSEIVPPSSSEFGSPDSRGAESSGLESGPESLELVARSRAAGLESVQPAAIEQDDAEVQRVLSERSQSSGARRRSGALIWWLWGAGVLAVSYYFLMHR